MGEESVLTREYCNREQGDEKNHTFQTYMRKMAARLL